MEWTRQDTGKNKMVFFQRYINFIFQVKIKINHLRNSNNYNNVFNLIKFQYSENRQLLCSKNDYNSNHRVIVNIIYTF